jgi:membrane dipeptidase
VNYCKDFLGRGATFADLLAHVKHIVNVGGEDAVALGSDFDGIPAPPDLEDCLKVPVLLQYLQDNLGYRLTRKLRHENFTRVFRAVCG